jgi:hypothetical protein
LSIVVVVFVFLFVVFLDLGSAEEYGDCYSRWGVLGHGGDDGDGQSGCEEGGELHVG